jgi:hypothetical protein
VRLVDGLPVRSLGSTSGSLSEDRPSWVIIRCAPGEAGNRATISNCLEQSKDNRPESPHWKLGCLVDGDAVIFFGFSFEKRKKRKVVCAPLPRPVFPWLWKIKSLLAGLNHRPFAYKANALPLS